MIKIFVPIQKKIWKFDEIRVDSIVFRLHYRVSFVILIASSFLVTSKQFFGDPIDCIVDGVPQKVIDTYCWIQSTFTIPERFSKDPNHFPHHGVAPLTPGDEIQYHKYYQWVCFVLFLQAICFYIPHYLWKSQEAGKVKMLLQNLQNPILEKESKEKELETIIKYLRIHRGRHTFYAIKFYGCEFLNMINVISQIFFTNYFLNYEFTNYGIDVINYSEMETELRPDPMAVVFPKVTKCTFHKYGPSGTIENRDGLCVLPLNIINEKIYIMLWFWFIILSLITAFHFLSILIVIFSSQLRHKVIKNQVGKSITPEEIETILESKLTYFQKIGDWQLLYFIMDNVDTLTVNALIKGLFKEFNHDETGSIQSSTVDDASFELKTRV